MMPRTLTAFLVALVLLLVALATGREAQDGSGSLPLDLAGIEVVEVIALREPTIIFSTHAAPRMEYTAEANGRVTARRVGDRLVIESSIERYGNQYIHLPASVRRLVVQEAAIQVSGPLESLQLEVAEGLSWQGNAGRLEIIHAGIAPPAGTPRGYRRTARAGCNRCDGAVRIDSGRITNLQVTSASGHVVLGRSDQVADARLRLGAGATFSLHAATHFDNIHLERLGEPAPLPADHETLDP